MAAKKTWYFHGTTDDTWGDVANWTANHVYNVADANPTYPPWTNTSEFPDADIRKGSAYTGTDITLDVAIGASEWDGTYNATTFIGVENLSVNITLDYNLPASINGGIWTSTIYGNIECPITGGIFFGDILNGGVDGLLIGRDESLSVYNKWLPVFFGSVNTDDATTWHSGIFLGDVTHTNSTLTNSVLRGSINAISLVNCAVYSVIAFDLEVYDGTNGLLTDTIWMKNQSTSTDERKFPRVLKDCVFMGSLTSPNMDALVNSQIGNCYFHGSTSLTLPPSATVSGGIFRGETHIQGSVGVSPSGYNNQIHPPIFCNAVVDQVLIAITGNSIASPTVVTATAHGLISGSKIKILDNNIAPYSNSSASIIGTHTITKIGVDTFSIPVSNLSAGTFAITTTDGATSTLTTTSTTAQVQTALRAISGFGASATVIGTNWTSSTSGTYIIDRVTLGAYTLPTITSNAITVGGMTLTLNRTGTAGLSARWNLIKTLSAGTVPVNAEVVHELENAIFTQSVTSTATLSTSASSIFAAVSPTSRSASGYSSTESTLNLSTDLSGTAAVVGFYQVELSGSVTGGYISGIGATISGAISGGLFAVNSLITSGGISGSTAKFMGSVLTNSGTVTGGVIFSTGIVNTGTLSNGCTVYGTFTTKGTQSAKMPIDQIGIE